jgi:methylenetetrahydrofolate dehydrogenase (NADP+)/methenyltetrahydrofolate cyclohydrolase
MIIDGKKIADDVRENVRSALARAGTHLTLGVLSVGENAVTRQFIGIKKRVADALGVAVVEHTLSERATTQDILSALSALIAQTRGVIVQLPLPPHVDAKKIFAAIPASHDVDCLGDAARELFETEDSPLAPPVVAAIQEILGRYSIDVAEKRAVVVGTGRLVGAPASVWLSRWGAFVTPLNDTDDVGAYTKNADLIVLGAGHPRMLTPQMIKKRSSRA